MQSLRMRKELGTMAPCAINYTAAFSGEQGALILMAFAECGMLANNTGQAYPRASTYHKSYSPKKKASIPQFWRFHVITLKWLMGVGFFSNFFWFLYELLLSIHELLLYRKLLDLKDHYIYLIQKFLLPSIYTIRRTP